MSYFVNVCYYLYQATPDLRSLLIDADPTDNLKEVSGPEIIPPVQLISSGAG